MNFFTLDIYVSQKMIDKGISVSCDCCPVALALREAIKKDKRFENWDCSVQVRNASIFIYKKFDTVYKAKSLETTNFICAFDHPRSKKYATPFKVELAFKKCLTRSHS